MSFTFELPQDYYAVGDIIVRATDAAGNVSGTTSNPFIFTIDTDAPDIPIISTIVTPNNDNTPTIAGTGVSGDTITLYAGSTAIGSVTIGVGSTSWSITPTNPLNDGSYVITAVSTDPASNQSAVSVSQTIVGATEEKLKTFILETTSKLLGEKIEELPEKYVTKISGIINELSTKTDEITVTLNKEDLAAIKKVKTFKDFLYSFAADEALMRGEFKIKSGKLTSEVKLYENSINEIEPNEL